MVTYRLNGDQDWILYRNIENELIAMGVAHYSHFELSLTATDKKGASGSSKISFNVDASSQHITMVSSRG